MSGAVTAAAASAALGPVGADAVAFPVGGAGAPAGPDGNPNPAGVAAAVAPPAGVVMADDGAAAGSSTRGASVLGRGLPWSVAAEALGPSVAGLAPPALTTAAPAPEGGAC